jgi:sugar phosphate isomerase/epimerase
MMEPDRAHRILWAATFPAWVPLSARVEAANAAGFGHLSITPWEAENRPGGFTSEAALATARSAAVRLSVLECATEWYPHEPPRRPFQLTEYTTGRLLEICSDLGIGTLSALVAFPWSAATTELARHFGELCDRAAAASVRVQLEFAPMTALPTLQAALELLALADRPNAGLAFDTWHFFRAGADWEALADLSAEAIFTVQLSDCPETPGASLIRETYRERLIPGEGDMDLARALAAIGAAEGEALIGPEILSDPLHALPAAEIATRSAAATERVIAASRGCRGAT